MPRLPLLLILVLAVASPAYAQREHGFDNRKGSGQPYWKPEETVAKFKVPDEFEVKLFAGEPKVTNPVAFTIDEKGRIWVVECFEYPKRTPKGKAPRDRIVILEDTTGDGVCDKRTVFAEGKDFPVPEERAKAGLGAFDLCTGIEVGHGGVFVGAAPYLWFIENKDDKPGKFEVLLKGFGSQDTHETLNTFQWGPDGWLYGMHGIFTNSDVSVASGDRKAPDGKEKSANDNAPPVKMNAAVWRYRHHPTRKRFEIFAEGTSNPWGMDWRNTDGQFILCACVIPHLYHIVPGGIYKRQAGASFNPYVYGYLNEICDHTFHKESGWAHAGLISLDVPHMPKRFQNSVIFGSIHGSSIKQNILEPNGSTYLAKRGDDFLTSADKNFRPINMKWGPNGDIYLIDWHDQYPCHQTPADEWDYDHGRIYRIQLKGTKTKKAEDLGKLSVDDLLDRVGSDQPYVYRTALRLVAERTARGEVTKEPLPRIASGALRYLWMSDASDELLVGNPVSVARMLDPDNDRLVGIEARAWSARHAWERATDESKMLSVLTAAAAKEPSPAVRRELASAAIRLSDKHDVTPLVRALMSHKEDAKDPVIPQLVWIAYEKTLMSRDRKGAGQEKEGEKPLPTGRGSIEEELNWLAEHSPKYAFVREQIVSRVMRRLVATGKPEHLAFCVEFVTMLKQTACREKALEGLSIALAGQSVDAPEGWAALQAEIVKGDNARLIALANKLAVVFRDPAALKRAIEAVSSVHLLNEERAEAVRQLGSIRAPETIPLLLNLLRKDGSDLVRSEAARALANFDKATIPAELLANWKEYPKTVRPDVVNALATRKEWAKALLLAMEKKTIDRTDVTDNVILRIQAFNDRGLNELIEKSWGRTRQTPAELAKLIDKTRESLYDAPASFERGRKVFETNCAKCHKFDGKGTEVGPALDGAGRDIEYILGNVLDPNRVIGAPYFVRTARLQDETIFQGLLAEEDETTITLKLENGVLKKIKKADLDGEVRVAEKSLMPEGLGYNMTQQDFRDLVRYLMVNPFLTDVTLDKKKVSVGVHGRIPLPEAKGAPVVIEAEITSPGMKTKLLIGATGDYEVRHNGAVIGSGKGAGKDARPDRDSHDIHLHAGKQTLTIIVKDGGGVVYARFLDPDRKLRYPDEGVTEQK